MLCAPVTYEADARQMYEPAVVDAPVLRAVDQARDVAVGGAAAGALFGDANEIARGIRLAFEVAPPVVGAAEAGVEQQPARRGRRPCHLRHAQRLRRADADRLGRDPRRSR